MLIPLDVTAALEFTSGLSTIRINGDGDKFTAEAADLRSAFSAYLVLRSSLAGLHRLLCSTGLGFDLRIREVVVVRLGIGARPTWMGALLGASGAEFRVSPILRASVRSGVSASG